MAEDDDPAATDAADDAPAEEKQGAAEAKEEAADDTKQDTKPPPAVGPGMEGFRKRATVRFSQKDLEVEVVTPEPSAVLSSSSVRATLNKTQVEQLMAEPSGAMGKLEEEEEGEEGKEEEEDAEGKDDDKPVLTKKATIRLELVHPRNAGNKEFTVIAFVNAASGGRKGEQVHENLVTLLGKDFVYDLDKVSPGNMPEDILIKYCLDAQVRVLACGGDGTMGWIESSLDTVWSTVLGPGVAVETTKYKNHLPLAIMPLGTGNDLSRTFGWGPKYSKRMGKPEMISNVIRATPQVLDRWRCVVIPDNALDEDTKAWIPEMLGSKKQRNADVSGSIFDKREAEPKHDGKNGKDDGDIKDDKDADGEGGKDAEGEDDKDGSGEGDKDADQEKSVESKGDADPEPAEGAGDAGGDSDSAAKETDGEQDDGGGGDEEHEVLDGIFCNYLSIGYDAQVAFSFHTDRKEHPEKYTSVTGNKVKYAVKGIQDGTGAPKLHDKLRVFVTNRDGSNDDLMELEVPKRCRAVALLNIPSYAGGTKLARSGKRDDGLIDVIFMTTVWRFALISGVSKLIPFTRYTVAAKVSRVCIKTHETLHCQVDGEPWKQGAATINVRHFGRSSVLEREVERKVMPWSCGGKWATGA